MNVPRRWRAGRCWRNWSGADEQRVVPAGRPWRHRRGHRAGRPGAGPACPGAARAAGGIQDRPGARPG
ncbi:hypothetical protein G6F61_014540 [Rhizopus arrhizus]|nr:hypothetical protein G6F61_014540 [Rhizopus arrhizus]